MVSLRNFTSRATSVIDSLTRAASEAWRGPPVITNPDGDEHDYENYFADVISSSSPSALLGEGEFGEVHLVRNKQQEKEQHNNDSNKQQNELYFAVKIMNKGHSIRDNVVYSPPKPGILDREVSILRLLKGKRFCLELHSVYESARFVHIVTEVCSHGDLKDFRKRCWGQEGTPMRWTDIVRTASYQILNAVDHCAWNGVIHRDIKPENVMVAEDGITALKQQQQEQQQEQEQQQQEHRPLFQLKLIDFGSGALDLPMSRCQQERGNDDNSRRHVTYAGSAFYNSPEMFRRSYTNKTDIWSTGVTLYVLACGYPEADILQDVFDVFQKRKSEVDRDNLKELLMGSGNLEESKVGGLPDSFWDMLKELLVHRYQDRMNASEILKFGFAKEYDTEGSLETGD